MQQDVQEHQRRAERIEALIEEIAAFPDPQARATTQELVQALLDMYGEGLARLLELTAHTEASGHALIEAFARDDLLSALFMLHDLHPLDIEERIAQALVEVRPYLKSHGGNVELVRVEDNIAYLRLEGSCHGCPSSTITLKLAIEEAIYKAAPDLIELKVEGVTEPPRPGIPVAFVPPRRRKDSANAPDPLSVWYIVEQAASLSNSKIQTITVQNTSILFCHVADTSYAYHNRCSSCGTSLADSTLDGTTLICSVCGRSYDVSRAGRCLDLDAPSLFLEAVPLLVEHGKVKVALSALAKNDSAEAIVSAPAR